jgi:phytoene dehydrogenase-like protein
MEHTDDRIDVVVVGGGIAGLAAAVTASTKGASVVVLEGHGLGGRARTTRRAGVAYNVGPHALYEGGALARLLRDVGVDAPGRAPNAVDLRVASRGVLTPVSLTPLSLVRTSLLRSRSRARLLALFAGLGRLDPDRHVGRSLADWLGDEPGDVRAFVEMIVRLSTYSNDPTSFDAGAAIEQLQLARRGVRYVDGGWATIVGGLRRVVERHGCRVRTDTEVTRVFADASGEVEVVIGGDALRARSVVIAAGAPAVAERLTGATVADHPGLGAPSRASCLDLAVSRPHEGIVLGLDRALYLSPHAPVARLAPAGQGLVSVARYLSPRETSGGPDGAAELHDLARLAGIADEEVLHARYLAGLTVTYGTPVAAAGGRRSRPAVDSLGIPGVFLAGDWVGPEGLLADAAAASGVHAGEVAADLTGRAAA